MRYFACYAVVDVDDWDRQRGGGGSVLGDAQKLAKEEGIRLLITNPQFEAWLLWHCRDNVPADPRDLTTACSAEGWLDGKRIRPSFPISAYREAAARADRRERVKCGEKGGAPSSGISRLVDDIHDELG